MSSEDAFKEVLKDHGNAFAVGWGTLGVVILNPQPMLRGSPLSHEEVLNLTAWLCVVGGVEPDELAAMIRKTQEQEEEMIWQTEVPK